MGPSWRQAIIVVIIAHLFPTVWKTLDFKSNPVFKLGCEHQKVESCSSSGFILSGPACGVPLGVWPQQCPRLTPSEIKSMVP